MSRNRCLFNAKGGENADFLGAQQFAARNDQLAPGRVFVFIDNIAAGGCGADNLDCSIAGHARVFDHYRAVRARWQRAAGKDASSLAFFQAKAAFAAHWAIAHTIEHGRGVFACAKQIPGPCRVAVNRGAVETGQVKRREKIFRKAQAAGFVEIFRCRRKTWQFVDFGQHFVHGLQNQKRFHSRLLSKSSIQNSCLSSIGWKINARLLDNS